MSETNSMLDDLPVTNKEEDAFQRYPFASRIASVIEESKSLGSFVVGIYGKWGEGKSSVLNFIKKDLEQKDDIIIVEFNPWLFSNEDQLLLTFFNILASEIDRPLKSKKEKVGEALLEYGKAIGAVGNFVGFNGKEIMEVLGKKLSETSINQYKERVNTALEEVDKRVVVIIDDIDRLDINEIQIVFRLIKLVANFKNTVYLLSFDDELVAAALDGCYAKGGYDYLEKIIQLPLRLPKAQLSALRKYTLDAVNKALNDNGISLSEDEIYRFIEYFDKCFLRLITTPRIAVRYTNAISFLIPMLKGEVNVVDLLMIEGVKVTMPGIYNFIRDNSGLLTRDYSESDRFTNTYHQKIEDARGQIEAHIDVYNHGDRKIIKQIITNLFPNLEEVLGHQSHSYKTWRDFYKGKRLCSGRYFERYFTYVVLEGEISDVVFDHVTEQISQHDFINHQKELMDLFIHMKPEDVALKLQFLEESFDSETKLIIALNLCLMGEYFPEKDSGGFRIMAAQQQMAHFILSAIENQDETERMTLVKKILGRAWPMNFAFEIWRLLHPNSKSKEVVLLDTELKEASKVLYSRCKKQYSLDQLYNHLYDAHFRYMLNIGGEIEPKTLRNELKEWMESDNSNFMKLLCAYSQTTYSHSSNSSRKSLTKKYKSHFSEEFYKQLSGVMDMDFFFETSVLLFGDHSEFSPESDIDELSEEQLVGWFQKIHKTNIEEV
ncbi:KAP family NTPase [Echinicola marina]|uniref:KAP family P-loop NTPase fold protein n=1 Tax=Echinicola marina TaxID=2859768 RepID=UPI001CF71512|nr:P-loop NTPase fold protein [Echinicola marina]UCS95032.1 KAP family NTPase [Echinicola marina]